MTNVGHWDPSREGCGWRVRTGEPGDLVQPAPDNTPSAKRGLSVRTSLRFTLAAACAAGLVAVPVATALDTTIRVEGSSATLIPESAIPIEGSGTATVFDKNFAAVNVSRSSAFWQLYRATQSTGLGFGFEYFPAFSSSLVQKIGPDENVGSTGWQFRVNHVASAGGRRRHHPRAGRDGALVLRRLRRRARARRHALERQGHQGHLVHRQGDQLLRHRRGPAGRGRHRALRPDRRDRRRRGLGHVRRPGQRHAAGHAPAARATSAAPAATSARTTATRRSATCPPLPPPRPRPSPPAPTRSRRAAASPTRSSDAATPASRPSRAAPGPTAPT